MFPSMVEIFPAMKNIEMLLYPLLIFQESDNLTTEGDLLSSFVIKFRSFVDKG